MSKVCLEQKVNWWQIKSGRSRVLIGQGFCMEVNHSIYAEKDDGSIVEFNESIKTIGTIWNFNLLPENKIELAKNLYELGRIKELTQLNNEYLISGDIICCDTEAVRLNFKYAIENGLI